MAGTAEDEYTTWRFSIAQTYNGISHVKGYWIILNIMRVSITSWAQALLHAHHLTSWVQALLPNPGVGRVPSTVGSILILNPITWLNFHESKECLKASHFPLVSIYKGYIILLIHV
jgi:drug/metabolite transporter superfamily protein YnfA